MNTKIFVCCHKEFPVIKSDNIIPIQGGRKISNIKLNMIGDDTGDNISEKNKSWCELTVLYWMWKNIEADAYGLFHYRRFLKLSWHYREYFNPLNDSELANLGLTQEKFDRLLEKYDIITSPRWNVHPVDLPCNIMSNYEFYCRDHYKKDIDIVEDIIKDKFKEYYFPMLDVLTSKTCFFGNIFIMKKKYFFEFMEWLFAVLEEAEQKIDIRTYSVYQKRIFGFLAERLSNVYVNYAQRKYNVAVKEFPIIKPKYNSYNIVKNDIIDNLKKLKNDNLKEYTDDCINIAYCVDNNYIKYCATSLYSILSNVNRNQKLSVFILHDGSIEQQNFNKYNLIFEEFKNCKIKFIKIAKDEFADFPLNRNYISFTTYFRLRIYDFIPSDIDKILYIDCDTIINKNIVELWKTELNENLLAAADDEGGITQIRRLRLPDTYRYFNAGVILFNVKQMRNEKIYNKFVSNYFLNRYAITLQDQDILNLTCVNRVKYIDLAWNSNSRLYRFNELERAYNDETAKNAAFCPFILHFTDKDKPWQEKCKHPLKDIYYLYANAIKWDTDKKSILKPYIERINDLYNAFKRYFYIKSEGEYVYVRCIIFYIKVNKKYIFWK